MKGMENAPGSETMSWRKARAYFALNHSREKPTFFPGGETPLGHCVVGRAEGGGWVTRESPALAPFAPSAAPSSPTVSSQDGPSIHPIGAHSSRSPRTRFLVIAAAKHSPRARTLRGSQDAYSSRFR